MSTLVIVFSSLKKMYCFYKVRNNFLVISQSLYHFRIPSNSCLWCHVQHCQYPILGWNWKAFTGFNHKIGFGATFFKFAMEKKFGQWKFFPNQTRISTYNTLSLCHWIHIRYDVHKLFENHPMKKKRYQGLSIHDPVSTPLHQI